MKNDNVLIKAFLEYCKDMTTAISTNDLVITGYKKVSLDNCYIFLLENKYIEGIVDHDILSVHDEYTIKGITSKGLEYLKEL